MERACWRDSALRVLLYAPGCRLDGVERSTAIAGVRVSFSCISIVSVTRAESALSSETSLSSHAWRRGSRAMKKSELFRGRISVLCFSYKGVFNALFGMLLVSYGIPLEYLYIFRVTIVESSPRAPARSGPRAPRARPPARGPSYSQLSTRHHTAHRRAEDTARATSTSPRPAAPHVRLNQSSTRVLATCT